MPRLLPVSLLAALLATTAVVADQDDPRLEDLFKQLHDAPDMATAAPVEAMIWQLWVEQDDPAASQLMFTGIEQMNRNNLSGALATFDELVQLAPQYAEAWNKRATLYYLMGEHDKSELDIQKTLELEPFHFGALSGRGLVRMGKRDFEGARNAFNAALEVHPNMDAVRGNLSAIDEFLRGRSI
jgi:Flp pilus assembly protein TadD